MLVAVSRCVLSLLARALSRLTSSRMGRRPFGSADQQQFLYSRLPTWERIHLIGSADDRAAFHEETKAIWAERWCSKGTTVDAMPVNLKNVSNDVRVHLNELY